MISTDEDYEENKPPDVGEERIVSAIKEIAHQTSHVEDCIKNPRLIVIY